MSGRKLDDLSRLVSRTPFENKYKVFTKTPVPRVSEPEAGEQFSEVAVETIVEPVSAVPLEATPASPEVQSKGTPAADSPAKARPATDPETSRVSRLTANSERFARMLSVVRTRRNVQVAIRGTSGGSGATTVVATLAAAFAASGELCTVVDPTADGLLPYYFGAPAAVPHSVTVMQSPRAGVEPVQLVRRREDEPTQSFERESVRPLFGSYDWMLVDGRELDSCEGMRLEVFVVTPDLGSLLRLRGLLLEHTSAMSPAIVVLNRFDPSVPLHNDVKNALASSTWEGGSSVVLAPHTIRRSDAIAESLADGGTVFDFAPDSGVAQDYRDLAAWLCRYEESLELDGTGISAENRGGDVR